MGLAGVDANGWSVDDNRFALPMPGAIIAILTLFIAFFIRHARFALTLQFRGFIRRTSVRRYRISELDGLELVVRAGAFVPEVMRICRDIGGEQGSGGTGKTGDDHVGYPLVFGCLDRIKPFAHLL